MARKKKTTNGTTTSTVERVTHKLSAVGEHLAVHTARWSKWPEDDKGYITAAVTDVNEAIKLIERARSKVAKMPADYRPAIHAPRIAIEPGTIVAISDRVIEEYLGLGYKPAELKSLEVISRSSDKSGRLRVKTKNGSEIVIPRIQVTLVSAAPA